MQGVKDGNIVWGYDGKHGEDISAGITVEDARWLLTYLSGITTEELRIGLRASGASPGYAERISRSIRNRIAQLQQITGDNVRDASILPYPGRGARR